MIKACQQIVDGLVRVHFDRAAEQHQCGGGEAEGAERDRCDTGEQAHAADIVRDAVDPLGKESEGQHRAEGSVPATARPRQWRTDRWAVAAASDPCQPAERFQEPLQPADTPNV